MYSKFSLKRTQMLLIITIFLSGILFVSFSGTAEALGKPFGGRTTFIISCMDGAIYTIIGPPTGGSYLWTLGTRTYLFGPPSVGRWNLGIAGPPSICVVSINPPVFFFGLVMIMLGTSGGI